MFATNSTGTYIPSSVFEKINACIWPAKRNLEKMVEPFTHIVNSREEYMPSPNVWKKTDSRLGIDMSYNTLMNVNTASTSMAVNNVKKHPGRQISLSEAYEKAGRVYENAEAQRQVLREQEARLFFGLLGDE